MTKLVAKIERDYPELIAEARAARAAGRKEPETPSALWLACVRYFNESLGPASDEVLFGMRPETRDLLLMQAMRKATEERLGGVLEA